MQKRKKQYIKKMACLFTASAFFYLLGAELFYITIVEFSDLKNHYSSGGGKTLHIGAHSNYAGDVIQGVMCFPVAMLLSVRFIQRVIGFLRGDYRKDKDPERGMHPITLCAFGMFLAMGALSGIGAYLTYITRNSPLG